MSYPMNKNRGGKSIRDFVLMLAKQGIGITKEAILNALGFTPASADEIPEKLSELQDDIGVSGKADASSLSTVATSGEYADLIGKPTIPDAVTESTVSGWGFTKNNGTYSKPSGGIPKTDLSSAVQTSLAKADTALQSFTETDPTVPDWAKNANKPTYTASEVGAVPINRTVNGKALSSNISLNASDVGALPASTVIPTVPTVVSAFTNDASYLTPNSTLDASKLSVSYLPTAGGVISGEIKTSSSDLASKTNETAFLRVSGGTTGQGAKFVLFGKEHATQAGQFQIASQDANGVNIWLNGRPNGELRWKNNIVLTTENGLPLSGGTMTGDITFSVTQKFPVYDNKAEKDLSNVTVPYVIEETMSGYSWSRKWSNGTHEQAGYASTNTNGYKYVPFGIPFLDAEYGMYFDCHYANGILASWYAGANSRTNTGFNLQGSITGYELFIGWYARGRWK